MTQAVYRDTHGEIQIALAIIGEQITATSMVELEIGMSIIW